MTMSKGMQAIQGEYDHAQEKYGENDKKHTKDQLIYAAEAHIYAADGETDLAMEAWPWAKNLFHVNTPSSSLAKAAGLLASELDRRFAAGECKDSDFGHPYKFEE